ncbi:MAG: hypothetical protein ACI90V_006546 [Bacillariaceae sp.]|jgi:hypothetical protein
MSGAVAESDVTIKLKYGVDDSGEYNAFTYMDADILVCGSIKAGKIAGTIVPAKDSEPLFSLRNGRA